MCRKNEILRSKNKKEIFEGKNENLKSIDRWIDGRAENYIDIYIENTKIS